MRKTDVRNRQIRNLLHLTHEVCVSLQRMQQLPILHGPDSHIFEAGSEKYTAIW